MKYISNLDFPLILENSSKTRTDYIIKKTLTNLVFTKAVLAEKKN